MTYDGHRNHDPGSPLRRSSGRGWILAVVALVVAVLLYLFPLEAASLLALEGPDESLTQWMRRIAVGIAVLGAVVAVVTVLLGARQARTGGTPQSGDW